MKRALAKIGVALSMALMPVAAFAGSSEAGEAVQEWATSVPIFQQRQDVREVALPRPTYGPATPHPFCTPAQPICP